MVRELRVDGDVGNVQPVDVGHTVDLDRHSEGGGCQGLPSDFEDLLSHVVISHIVLNLVGQVRHARGVERKM